MPEPLRLVPPVPAADSTPPPEPACADCSDAEWIVTAGAAVPCRCRAARVARESVEVARQRVPPRYRAASRQTWEGPWPAPDFLLATWPTAPAGELLRPWCVLVIGPVAGAGKTHVASAIYASALARIERPLEALWITAVDAHRAVTEEIQLRIAADREGRAYRGRDTRQLLHESPLLLLDDVGREGRPTEASRSLIVSALMHRHAHALPTIITSNFSQIGGETNGGDPVGFHAYDPALSSRLTEDTLVMRLKGADRRPGGRAA